MISNRPLVWLHGEIQTPPFSPEARLEAGYLLRKLQMGDALSLPHSRSMQAIGTRVHELRITDRSATLRIIYRIDDDAIVIIDVFSKKTRSTPKRVIDVCQERLARYDEIMGG